MIYDCISCKETVNCIIDIGGIICQNCGCVNSCIITDTVRIIKDDNSAFSSKVNYGRYSSISGDRRCFDSSDKKLSKALNKTKSCCSILGLDTVVTQVSQNNVRKFCENSEINKRITNSIIVGAIIFTVRSLRRNISIKNTLKRFNLTSRPVTFAMKEFKSLQEKNKKKRTSTKVTTPLPVNNNDNNSIISSLSTTTTIQNCFVAPFCSNLCIPTTLQYRYKDLLLKIKDILEGRNPKTVAATFIYYIITDKDKSISCTLKQISTVATISQSTIKKCYKIITKKFETTTNNNNDDKSND